LAAVTGQTFVRIEPNSVKTDIDLENRVNLRLYQPIANGEAVDFTIRVAAPQVEAGFVASPFISTVSGAVSEVRGRPSILVVPQLTKEGVVYPQLPVVSGADFTFTRATTATRVNASGLIESVASGVLRLDYPIGGGCPAALIEPSAQNLAWHSQTWATGTNWGLSSTTTVTGTTGTLDPLGTNTANAISPTSASEAHLVLSNNSTVITFTSGTIYTQSAFFKQGTGAAGRYVQLSFSGVRFTQAGYANFDLQTGALVASGGTADTNRAASIENYGNGWYRCRFTATCNSTGTGVGVIPVLITASGDTRIPSFTGVTGDVLYGWGAQVETGSIATSYIPTTAAAVTRNADVITLSGAVSGCIGQTEGTMYWEGAINRFNREFLTLASGSSTTQCVRLQTTGAGLMQFIVISGTIQANIQTSGAITLGQFYKVAGAYKENDFVFFLNGTQVGVKDTSGTLPTNLNSVYLLNSNGTEITDQRCRAAALYTTRLTDSELIALSTL
jgi:hypothetical protein